MNTIRRKISIGFVALGIILVGSGAISIGEMRRLQNASKNVLTEGNNHSVVATRMLDALQKQNSAVLEMIMTSDTVPSKSYLEGAEEFRQVLESVAHKGDVAAIEKANTEYRELVSQHKHSLDESDEKQWYMDSYMAAYYTLDRAIKEYFVVVPEEVMTARMSSLEKSVYKTITPSILTQIVALLVVLMLYFFVDTYYTKPVVKINRGVKNYIKNTIPYRVKIEEKSELMELNNSIIELVENNKKLKQQQ